MGLARRPRSAWSAKTQWKVKVTFRPLRDIISVSCPLVVRAPSMTRSVILYMTRVKRRLIRRRLLHAHPLS